MIGIHAAARTDRRGRPLLFSVTETVVLVLVALSLIASAAIPAMVRNPHIAQARTVASAGPDRP